MATMKNREFHIWNFPEKSVRILFRRDFQIKYFNICIKHFGIMNDLAKFLNVSSSAISFWKKNGRFTPLWVIKKTINFTNWSWEFVEQNIVSYKGVSTSKPIKNPILPIKESPELFEILTHLICDGCVDKLGRPIYINYCEALQKRFQKLLRKCFGEVYGRSSNNHEYRFSKIVPDLIKNFYDIRFGSLTGYIPTEAFTLSEEFAKSIIGAVVDDEGNIRENRIVISLKNKKLIFQIRKLLIKIFGEDCDCIGKITSKNDLWTITIKSKGLKKFLKEIKLVHPEKRAELRYAVKKSYISSTGIGKPPWETKIKILKLLKKKINKSKKIAKKLFINQPNINAHLYQLEKTNFVKRIRKEKHAFIWSITEEGIEFLKNWTFKERKRNIQLPNWYKEFELPPGKPVRVLLNDYGRSRLFWMLERILPNQDRIGYLLGVHRNTISYWKNGKFSIPLVTLNDMLKFLGENGVDIVDEIKNNVKEIRYINGLYTIYQRR